MADPIGELEELIERALETGPDRALAPHEAAEWLASVLAPQVVLRTQLEHVGWLNPRTGEVGAQICYESEEMNDAQRAVFTVPPRVVSGSTVMVLGGAMGGQA